jgi:uncharacterized protein YqeY
MRTRLAEATKAALKAQDKARLSALRLIRAALQERDIAAKAPVSDQEAVAVLQRMVKQRRESIDVYAKAGRQELADKEAAEIAVIEEFLPKGLSEAETNEAIAAAMKETGAAGAKDMGRVMGLLKQRYAGRMDFARASAAVKALLS